MKLCFGVSSCRIQNVAGGSPFSLEFYFFPVHREARLSRKEGILEVYCARWGLGNPISSVVHEVLWLILFYLFLVLEDIFASIRKHFAFWFQNVALTMARFF